LKSYRATPNKLDPSLARRGTRASTACARAGYSAPLGVAAATDMALRVDARMHGRDLARHLTKAVEYQ